MKINKLNYNAMLKDSNYLNPECIYVNIYAEGVLCSSVEEVDASNTETFDSLTDFEW